MANATSCGSACSGIVSWMPSRVSDTASLPPIEQAKIPYLPAQPTTAKTYTSPVAFDFNGGAATAYPAEAQFIAKTLKAKKVSIIYADLPTGLEVATDLAKKTLEKAGVSTKLIPAPYTGGDLSAQVALAKGDNPDVIWTIQTATSCTSVMQAAGTLGVTVPTIYDGACLSDKVVQGGGAGAKNAYFDVNFPIWEDTSNPDVKVYRAALSAKSASPVYSLNSELGFSQIMNVAAAMKAAGSDVPTAQSLTDFLNKGTTVKAFLSHDYTCDKKQVPERPALCNPYEKIAQWDGTKWKTVTNDWINGVSLLE